MPQGAIRSCLIILAFSVVLSLVPAYPKLARAQLAEANVIDQANLIGIDVDESLSKVIDDLTSSLLTLLRAFEFGVDRNLDEALRNALAGLEAMRATSDDVLNTAFNRLDTSLQTAAVDVKEAIELAGQNMTEPSENALAAAEELNEAITRLWWTDDATTVRDYRPMAVLSDSDAELTVDGLRFDKGNTAHLEINGEKIAHSGKDSRQLRFLIPSDVVATLGPKTSVPLYLDGDKIATLLLNRLPSQPGHYVFNYTQSKDVRERRVRDEAIIWANPISNASGYKITQQVCFEPQGELDGWEFASEENTVVTTHYRMRLNTALRWQQRAVGAGVPFGDMLATYRYVVENDPNRHSNGVPRIFRPKASPGNYSVTVRTPNAFCFEGEQANGDNERWAVRRTDFQLVETRVREEVASGTVEGDLDWYRPSHIVFREHLDDSASLEDWLLSVAFNSDPEIEYAFNPGTPGNRFDAVRVAHTPHQLLIDVRRPQ